MSITERIDSLIKEKGMSRRQLATAAGIPPSSFQSAMERGKNITVDMLKQVAAVLSVEWWQLVPSEELDSLNPKAEETVDYAVNNVVNNGGLTIIYTPQQRIDAALQRLNEPGQEKAVERVEELTEIPKYRKEADK